LQHPKTDDKWLPMADKGYHPKSLLNRYGTIMRRIEELCNQRDRFVWDKPQADHSEKSDYLEKDSRFFHLYKMI